MAQDNDEIIAKIAKNDPYLTSVSLFSLDDERKSSLIGALETNTKLKVLHVIGNKFTDVELQGIAKSNFNGLNLSVSNLTDQKLSCLGTMTRLTFLAIEKNQITAQGILNLSLLPNLTRLDAGSNVIKDEGAIVLASHLSITVLDVSFNKISDVGIVALANNTRLRRLWVNNNLITSAGLLALANNTNLTGLSLRDNKITDADIYPFRQNSTLRYFDIGCNHTLTVAGTATVAGMTNLISLCMTAIPVNQLGIMNLTQNTSLTKLHLDYCQIDDMVVSFLERMTSLTTLSLSNNLIKDRGAQDLANSQSLTSLTLDYNSITRVGAKALAENTKLISLILNGNEIDDEGARLFLANRNLIDITVHNSQTTNDTFKEVRRGEQLNRLAKDVQFIDQVVEIAKGCRQSQSSVWRTLPNEIVIIILMYVRGYNTRSDEQVINTCLFLLRTIRSTSQGKLNWNTNLQKSTFFKQWNQEKLKEVRSHFPKSEATTKTPQVTTQLYEKANDTKKL